MTRPTFLRRPHPLIAILSGAAMALSAMASAAAPGPAGWPDATERWVASSTTALSITGDLQVSGRQLVFGNGTTIAVTAAGSHVDFTDQGEHVRATVLRLQAPADVVLLNHNRLCGTAAKPRSATHVVLWRPEPLSAGEAPRAMAAFSGERAPTTTSDPSLCGVFYFERR